MRVTLKDIADEAGVSVMTVSNVINGNRARVSPETIKRVQRIVAKRGYVPSASARSLATKSSRLVGLLIPAADEDSLTLSPHTAVVLGQIERELRKRGYNLMLHGIAHPDEVIEALSSWSLDGAVLLGFLDEDIDRLGHTTVPLLAIDSYATNPHTTGVRSDDHTGAHLATSHLITLGHRDILFAGPGFTTIGVVHERYRGFRHAHTDAGLTWADSLIETVTTTHSAGVELGRRIPDTHPRATAVFATADILAIGIMEGLAKAGKNVPKDVSVVGFDNLDVSAYVTPKLTTVAQDIPTKAAMSVDLLLTAIEHGGRAAAATILNVHLVQRGSTAPPAS